VAGESLGTHRRMHRNLVPLLVCPPCGVGEEERGNGEARRMELGLASAPRGGDAAPFPVNQSAGIRISLYYYIDDDERGRWAAMDTRQPTQRGGEAW